MKVVKANKVKKPKETIVNIPKMDVRTIQVTLLGDTPLMVHRFTEKSRKQMEEKTGQKAKSKRGARDPIQEFKDAAYRMPNRKGYGMPASGIKLCAVSACRHVDGMTMTNTVGAFHVLEQGGGLIKIDGGEPEMDERPVRVGGFKKTAMIRYRPRWDEWGVTFKIKYNAGSISAEQILHLYETAGFAVGLCEARPECKGSNGMFSVKRG